MMPTPAPGRAFVATAAALGFLAAAAVERPDLAGAVLTAIGTGLIEGADLLGLALAAWFVFATHRLETVGHIFREDWL